MSNEFKVSGIRHLPKEYMDKDMSITVVMVDINNEMYESIIEIDKGGFSKEKLIDAISASLLMCDAEVKEVIVQSIKARKNG